MKTHELKTINPYFSDSFNGLKPYELRFNDRDFMVGDRVGLREYDPATDSYSGRTVRARVTHVLRGPIYGLAAGWVILGLADFSRSGITRERTIGGKP